MKTKEANGIFRCRKSDIRNKEYWDLVIPDKKLTILYGTEEDSKDSVMDSIQAVKSECTDDACYIRYRGFDHYYFQLTGKHGKVFGKSGYFTTADEMEEAIELMKEIASSAEIIFEEENGY